MWPRADRRKNAPRQTAVIDVGSNSVRLVIYRLEGRAIWTVFNEKALAGLGRDLPATGKLSAEGVKTALAALRRFHKVLEGWLPENVRIVATAAVRDAADGPDFVRQVEQITGHAVEVLSGTQEARFAALGVLAGQPNARGVVGDLGGSSLELTKLTDQGPGAGVTLGLGPFSLGAPKLLDVARTRRVIDAELAPVADRFASPSFHAVGGAWRNIALLHMAMADYPLRVAHQYEMSRSDALDVARFVERQSRASLERIPGVSKKRFDTLPHSALVLDALIEHLKIERIVVSAYGVREGVLLEAMPQETRERDPLLEGCDALTAVRGLAHDLGPALENWLAPAFDKLPDVFPDARDHTLMAATCRLADLGARLHPDHRGDLAFDQVLRAPIAGMNHCERAFLACAVFARHSTAPATPEAATISRILSTERRQRAKALGSAVRLGADLSGRNPALLAHSRLSFEGGRVALRAEPGWEDMLLGEQTAKRAATLASNLRLALEIA